MDRQLPIEKRAFYNLLWITQGTLSKEPIEHWQLEDLRLLSETDLWERLKFLGITIDEKGFLSKGSMSSSPEELTVALLHGVEDPKKKDQVYLVVFELWRRILPEKQTISLFCDELDHLIVEYDHGQIEDLSVVDEKIAILCEILKEEAKVLNDPLEAFEHISIYCANDLEGFLYDYLDDLLLQGFVKEAEEKIDFLSDFFTDPKWFLLLKARIQAPNSPEIAEKSIEDLIAEADAEPDLDFVFELLNLTVDLQKHHLFLLALKEALRLVRHESDFKELILISKEEFELQGREDIVDELDALDESRAEIPLELPLTPQDPALAQFYQIIEKPQS